LQVSRIGASLGRTKGSERLAGDGVARKPACP
jgi:hypothetical protein